MSYRLPSADHPAQAYFDMASLAEILAPANEAKLPSLCRAISAGRDNARVGARSVAYICRLDSTDDRVLILVGPRGGWKQLWNFGNGRT